MTMLDQEIQPLPKYVRFHNLRSAGLVANWQQLRRLQDEAGFPIGRLLSRNTRVWTLDEVNEWLASRPTERKRVIPRKKQIENAA